MKLLETANIKLAGVASDVFGVSGRHMLQALIAGEASPAEMAQLARGKLRRKLGELELALEGCVKDHHRFLLAMQLNRIEAIEADLDALDARLREVLAPYDMHMALLIQIPGVDWVIAATIIAEIGVDMSLFISLRKSHSPRKLGPTRFGPRAGARPGHAMVKANGGAAKSVSVDWAGVCLSL